MEFSIVAEFGIIEEDYLAKRHAACFPQVEISVNKHFAAELFQIPYGFR